MSNIIAGVVPICLGLMGCESANAPVGAPTGARTISLVASTPMLHDMVQNLVGGIEGVNVSSIVPLGSDPHEFEPTPREVRLVAAASAIVVIGAQYEDGWLSKLLQNAGGPRPLIVASAGVPLAKLDKAFNTEFDNDPHIWMDPERWQRATQNVADGIAALDPAIATRVQGNARDYIARLKELDASVRALVAQLPQDQRALVTTHDAMGYFAQRYGFRVVGAVIPSSSSAAEPSARGLRELIEKIRANNVKAVFMEAGINPKVAETVAKEANVRVVDQLFVDTLSDAGGPAATYIDMIRHNAQTILNNLK